MKLKKLLSAYTPDDNADALKYYNTTYWDWTVDTGKHTITWTMSNN